MLKRQAGNLKSYARSKQAKSTLWALIGLAGPTGLQLIYVIAAARLLGGEATGTIFLVLSVAIIASSFVGLGGGGIVMRDVSRDSDLAAISYGRATAVSFVTFPLLLPAVSAAAWYLTKEECLWERFSCWHPQISWRSEC